MSQLSLNLNVCSNSKMVDCSEMGMAVQHARADYNLQVDIPLHTSLIDQFHGNLYGDLIDMY